MKKFFFLLNIFFLFGCPPQRFPRYEVKDLSVVGLENSVLLSWVTPDKLDAKYAKFYARTEIYWGESEGSLKKFEGNVDPSHTLITGLHNNISYIFKLYIVDTNETYSNGVKQWGTPVDIYQPDGCHNLKIFCGNSSVRLSWNHPIDADYAGAIVWIANSDGIRQRNMKIPKGSGDISQVQIDNLLNNHKYYFFIQAYDYGDNKSKLAMISGTPDGIAPHNPILRLPSSSDTPKTECNDGAIKFVFNSPVDEDYDRTIVQFAKVGYVLKDIDVDIQPISNRVETFTLSNLENGTYYQILLVAVDRSGNFSSGSLTISELIPFDTVAPNKISDPYYNRSNNATFLSWKNPNDNDIKRVTLQKIISNSDAEQAKEVEFSELGSLIVFGAEFSSPVDVLTSNLGYVFTGTNNETAYIYKWTVYDISYPYSPSNYSDFYYFIPKVKAEIIPQIDPDPVIDVSFIEKNGKIEFLWSYTDPKFTTVVLKYGALPDENGSDITVKNFTGNSCVVDGLKNGIPYYFYLRNFYDDKYSVPTVIKAIPKKESSEVISFASGEYYNFQMSYVRAGSFIQGDNNIVSEKDVTISKDFYILTTETKYKLWYVVHNWAITNSETNYKFYRKGKAGNSGEEGTIPGNDKPVVRISWYDAIAWCNALTEFYNKFMLAIDEAPLTCAYKYPDTSIFRDSRVVVDNVEQFAKLDSVVCDFNATGFRLPTESEWEYCARWTGRFDLNGKEIFISGLYQSTNFQSFSISKMVNKPTPPYPTFHDFCWFGPTSGSLFLTIDDYGVPWRDGNCGSSVCEVAKTLPNELKLYDMSGNVLEWCWDWYKYIDYSDPPLKEVDPVGPKTGVFRVCRGGDAELPVTVSITAKRDSNQPFRIFDFLGFRFVKSVK